MVTNIQNVRKNMMDAVSNIYSEEGRERYGDYTNEPSK